jgi:hypothetical protein
VPKYLVTYDLVGDETTREYERLIAEIEGLDDFVEVQRSVWLVKTNNSAKEVRELLRSYMDRDDRLLIIRIARGSAWRNVLSGNGALKKFLAS